MQENYAYKYNIFINPNIERQTKHNSHKAHIKNIELLPFMQTRQYIVSIRLAGAKQERLV